MFAKLTTKIALRKAGLPSSFDTSQLTGGSKPSASKDRSELLPFANPFKDLQIPNSLKSWQTPPPAPIEVANLPVLGTRAPTSQKLRIPVPDGRVGVVVFLRWCGCPFAEKTFLTLRKLANKHPNISFTAVSHCSRQATDKWITALGGAWAINVVIDEEREVYAAWGLGVSTTWHLMNPWTQVAVRKLGTEEGIWGREVPADGTGNRWVVGGAWGVDELGSIRWGGPSKTADDIPNLEEAVRGLGVY